MSTEAPVQGWVRSTPRCWRRPFREPSSGHFLLAHLNRDDARSFIRAHHRHHPPPRGAILHLGCWSLWEAPAIGILSILLGVAFLGRPVSRVEQEQGTWEVTRLAVGPQAEHACSALYGYARRVAQLLNPGAVVSEERCWRFKASTITYTLGSEGGGSLRGAGWASEGVVRGRDWQDCTRRREQGKLFDRGPLAPTEDKIRWRAP